MNDLLIEKLDLRPTTLQHADSFVRNEIIYEFKSRPGTYIVSAKKGMYAIVRDNRAFEINEDMLIDLSSSNIMRILEEQLNATKPQV